MIRKATKRVRRVVERATALAADGVAVELVVIRRRADELGLVRVRETTMGDQGE